ncbi:hypothetical protein ABFX02_14G233800 [Erythranthe guttata]
MGADPTKLVYIIIIVGCCLFTFLAGGGVNAVTDQNDFKILNDFRHGLKNPELLKWPSMGNDPCGPPLWPNVYCSNGRVTQIQVQGLGLEGPLPPNLNQLTKLQNVGLQRNRFTGRLPTFSGLSELQFAYLDFNEFDTIPSDFFDGLVSVRVLALDNNPLNKTSGWMIPSQLSQSSQLVNFSCFGCNIIGPVPDFFGSFPSLDSLRLSYNRLSGFLPSTFQDSNLQVLWLNDQEGGGITGPIDVITTMVSLTQVWLHGNQFTGTIPEEIGRLTSLQELNLNSNRLVGRIPISLANMKNLQILNLNNNMFVGPIPNFKSANFTYASNSFCQAGPGEQCSPQVNALLDFLGDLNYPERLASEWTGNDPCGGHWWGITCDLKDEVSVVNLQKIGLNGTLSASLGNLSSLIEVHLEGNNLHGAVPANLTQLRSLRLLNLRGNNFEPPLPRFRNGVEVVIDDNPKFRSNGPKISPSPSDVPSSANNNNPPNNNNNSPNNNNNHPPPRNYRSNSPNVVNEQQNPTNSTKSRIVLVGAAVVGSAIFALLAIVLTVHCLRKKKIAENPVSSVVIHPRDPSEEDHSDSVKITVVDRSSSSEVQSGEHSSNLLISLQVLKKATNDFEPENELGRGGFGVVYMGELEDGTKLAVKRMVAGVMSYKALDEFQSEISVLSNVRHRHLVSLLGYSAEGDERLLVYEYMPRGALSRHLFRWKHLDLEPLSWKRRLNIALDVARGVEYLHSLAHRSFIHRDLKSANILLGDDFRAKVSDFGLVKLAPDRERSLATRLAGTFGYLAPEYAVTGKITTKVDVFSFGVILMELLTGLVALDEQRPEEKRYLAEWFWQIKSNRETVIDSVDPALDAKDEIYESIFSVAELAGHCTARDPCHRPEMGHAVNVLSQLVEKWNPTEERCGISNVLLPLPQMLKGWQEQGDNNTARDLSGSSEDSKGSIPCKPFGFVDSFTSADAR